MWLPFLYEGLGRDGARQPSSIVRGHGNSLIAPRTTVTTGTAMPSTTSTTHPLTMGGQDRTHPSRLVAWTSSSPPTSLHDCHLAVLSDRRRSSGAYRRPSRRS